ncbi:MAG: hypothetical protein H6861_09800 [Rhodospirillales bacterium]|nr:hypothetical protein [Rhodospirillales bacterium]
MISTSCVELDHDQVLGSLHFSAKIRAYWFFYTQSTTKQNIRNLKIYIYNETGCGPLITIENIYREPDIHWINETNNFTCIIWYDCRTYFLFMMLKKASL